MHGSLHTHISEATNSEVFLCEGQIKPFRSRRNKNGAVKQQRIALSKHGPCNQSFPNPRLDIVNISWFFVWEHRRTWARFMVYILININLIIIFVVETNSSKRYDIIFLIFSLFLYPSWSYFCYNFCVFSTYRYSLVLVASYNGWDALSRYIPLIKYLKIESKKWITACVLMRFLFVPAFYFTAKNADQGWMIILTSILGLTNGYLTVCILAVKPKSNYNVSFSIKIGLYICVHELFFFFLKILFHTSYK